MCRYTNMHATNIYTFRFVKQSQGDAYAYNQTQSLRLLLYDCQTVVRCHGFLGARDNEGR